MIVVKVRDRDIKAAPMGPVTTGSVGLPVSWHFSKEWDDLAKVAVFRVGNDGTEITVAVLEDLCLVPDELLVQANAGENLWIGVYGWDGEDDGEGNATIAMPTIWTYMRIQDGSQPSGIEPPEGTPGWSAQIQNATDEALRVAHGVAADADAGEFDGATFTPHVASNGVLSWTNDKDKENPEPVNITGPQGERGPIGLQGERGEQGIQGLQGDPGKPFTIAKIYSSVAEMIADFTSHDVGNGDFVMIRTADPDDPDNAKLYRKGNTGFEYIIDMSGIKGDKGDKGDMGDPLVFVAVYNQTTFEEIEAAIESGKIVAAYSDGMFGGNYCYLSDKSWGDTEFGVNTCYYFSAFYVDDAGKKMLQTMQCRKYEGGATSWSSEEYEIELSDDLLEPIEQDVAGLKSAFITDTEAITGNKPLIFIKGRYSTSAVPATGLTVTYHDSDDYMCAICPCEPGDVFNGHIYGYTGIDRAYFFCDSEMNLVSNGWAATNYEWNGKLTAPANSAFVAFSNRLSRLPDGYYVVKGKLLKDIVDSMILEPNGADQTQAIMSKLGTDGCCQLGKGDFYVSNIIMPAGSKLSGCGEASKLHFIDGATGSMVTMGDRCTVSDVSFYGAEYVDEHGNPISIETAKSSVSVSPDFPGSQIENESAVNLWTGGTVTMDSGLRGIVLDTPIEPGTYRVTVTLVRDDESSTAGRIRFSKNARTAVGTSDVIAQADFDKNDRKSATITVEQAIRAIQFISIIGSKTALSVWENLRITKIDANKSGIYWAGSDVHYGNVHNCRFFYFNIAGILMQDTGTPTDRNLYVSDCFFFKNNVGVYIRKNSEYNKFSNCDFNFNYYGSLNRGGNNYFSNCGFDSNYVGYQVDSFEGTNGGHGAVTNCSLNHSAPSNTGYGLIVDREEQVLVSNCVIAHSNVLLSSATGCILSSCMFIGNIGITINKGNSNMLIGNYFQGGNTIMRAIDNDKTKAINCYYMVSGSNVPLVTETT